MTMEEKYFCTDTSQIPKMVNTLRKNFYSQTPTSFKYRMHQIEQIIKFVDDCQDELIEACQFYYGGGKINHWMARLWIVKYDCYNAIKNLKQWMKSENKKQSFPLNLMWSASVEYHPLGVTAIIAPWNYPANLILRPLVGAIAAGNSVIIKPSEITDKVAQVFSNKLLKYLDPNLIQVVCGGANETTILLKQKLDFVLFTGGGSIGKIVMKTCSTQLTPCCLELGGKNPVIIDDDADLDTSLKRIIFGRFDFNGGQICVAPEMIFISRNKQKEAIDIIRKYLKEFYGNKGDTENSDSYFSIVSDRHFDRINKIRTYYLENASDKIGIGGKNDTEFGPEKVNKKTRHLPPMVLTDIDFNNDKIMEQEVFGPILSIIPMDGTINNWCNDAIQQIRSKDKPLAFYLFTRNPNSEIMKKFRNSISAGTICINDTIMFMALNDIPFGGVGESGMGRYGGKYSFKTFSQEKPIAIRSHGTEFFNKDRYPSPNIDQTKLAKVKKFYEGLYPRPESTFKKFIKYSGIIGAIVVFAYFYNRYRS
eukprot:411910_1